MIRSDLIMYLLDRKFSDFNTRWAPLLEQLCKEISEDDLFSEHELPDTSIKRLASLLDIDIGSFNNELPDYWGIQYNNDNPSTEITDKGIQQIKNILLSRTRYFSHLRRLPAKDLHEQYIAQRAIDEKTESDDEAERDLYEFFNDVDVDADLDYWRKMDSWTRDEITALSFKKDPRVVNVKSLQSIRRSSPFRQQYANRLAILTRAVRNKVLTNPIKSEDFYRWADKTDFPFPIMQRQIKVSDVADPGHQQENLSPQENRERYNLLRIIYALACMEGPSIALNHSKPSLEIAQLVYDKMCELNIRTVSPDTILDKLWESVSMANSGLLAAKNRARRKSSVK